jgi:hypothetical protein
MNSESLYFLRKLIYCSAVPEISLSCVGSESSLPCLQVPPDHIAWGCCTLKTVSNSFLESVSSLQLWKQLLCTKEKNSQSYNLKVPNLSTWISREKVKIRFPLLLIYWAQLTVMLEVMLHTVMEWSGQICLGQLSTSTRWFKSFHT